MRLLLALVLMLGHAEAARSDDVEAPRGSGMQLAAATDLVRHVPFEVRCDLVRTMFSDQAFERLASLLTAHCAQVARMGGRARVEVDIDTGPEDGETGVTPIESVFPETKRCEGRAYVVNPTETYWASNPYFISVAMTSVTRRSYDFNVTVAFPNGLHDCGGIIGHAVLKGGKWTISEAKPKPQ